MLRFNLPIPSRFEESRPDTFSSPLLSIENEGIYFFSYKFPIAKAGTFEPPIAFVGIFNAKPLGKEF